jgi:hypothetical protein
MGQSPAILIKPGDIPYLREERSSGIFYCSKILEDSIIYWVNRFLLFLVPFSNR